jgi:hypothetical protein
MSDPTYVKFSHLSVKDLIEARDMFHAHLINKKNVVATAIGRYLIRERDLDKKGNYKGSSTNERRTLANSMVIGISWPCILVFVEKWEAEAALIKHNASDLVPKAIYMPDGRIVPICIVEAPREKVSKVPDIIEIDRLRFPDNLIGGGYPLVVHSQGASHVASVGCVVTDGHKYYALTNKHVSGEEGEEIYSRFGTNWQKIGHSSGLSIGRMPFSSLYPDWLNKNTFVNCDVGLVEIDNADIWKTDVFVLGSFGELYDLNTINFDLGLIAQHTFVGGQRTTVNGKVVGYGAMSGKMEGEIAALFYRYKSVGGTEFVSDFLIAGNGGSDLQTHHGDSGTVWFYVDPPCDGRNKPTLRPIALHWGQHTFFGQGDESNRMKFSYGLATSLSNVCRELDVEIVRGWNVDSPYTWGKVGHYTVAACAIEAIADANLKTLMKANLSNITFANDKINAGLDTKDNPDLPKDPEQGLCPLADVPDIIWKQSKTKYTYGRMGDENPNHYADADAPSTNGKTLFEICDSKNKLTVAVWNKYYDDIDTGALGMDPSKPISKGLICFRVWQIYDYMVDALKNGNAEKFIFAAGVLAHYVGDGCQPLHSSYMSDGDPADNQLIDYTAKRTSKYHAKGDVYQKITNPGSGVHVAYEDHMIDDTIDDIFPKIPNSPVNAEAIDPINSGQAAGFAVLTLMKKTQDTILPKDIVEVFKAAKGTQNVSDALFEQFGDRTVDCLARGSNYLAAIWTAAWVQGNGDGNIANLTKVAEQKLIDLYANPNELPSKHLDTIGPLLT